MNPKNKTKRRTYPEKHRKHLAAKAKKHKPWEQSSGPKTPEGKAASSQNAMKHGLRSAEVIELRRLLRQQRDYLKALGTEP